MPHSTLPLLHGCKRIWKFTHDPPLLATTYAYVMQIFRDGDLKSPLEYNGPREAAGIVSFLKKQAGPAFHALSDASAVKDFVKLEDDKDVVGAQRQLLAWSLRRNVRTYASSAGALRRV